MRSKLFLAGVTFVIGCGGGGGKKAMIVDAMVDSPTIDAAAACSVNCALSATTCGPSFNMPSFPSLTFGSTKNTCRMNPATACTTDAQCEAANPNDFCDTRVDGDWFVDFEDAPLTGRRAFNIGLIMDDTANPDVLFIRLMKPETGGFGLNTDTAFDANAATPVPAAWSFWFGEATIANNQITEAAQIYWANMGAIKLTMVGENDGANISGGTSAITWREIDENNADVPGGCTATMGMADKGFAFNLLQQATPQPFQPQEHKGYPRQATGELAKSLNRLVDQKIAQLKLQQQL